MPSSRLDALGRAHSRSRLLFGALLLIVGSCQDATAPRSFSPDAAHPMLAMTASAQTVQVGASVTLTFDYNGNKSSTWMSSDTTVATVVPLTLHTARVNGKKPGTVTISATAGGTIGSVVITVVPVPVATVTLAPDSATLQRGDTLQFVATARDASGNVLAGRLTTWSSTDTAIVSVSSAGRAAARGRGTANIIATIEGRADTARFVVRQAQLLVASLSAPDSVWSDDGFWLRYSIQNLWDTPSADSVILRIGYRDSTGAVIGAQRRALPRVAGGATVQDSVLVGIAGAPNGAAISVVVYVDCRDGTGGTDATYLAACLASPASAGNIAEGNETDNSRSATLRVRLPNLMIISIPSSPDTVYTRGTVTRRYRLHNQGSAAGSGFEYIVGLRDMTTQSFVSAVGLTYGGLLGTRQSDTVAVTLNVPAVDPSHVYQFWAATDCPAQGNPTVRLAQCFTQPGSGSAVAELNELDNVDVYSPFVVASNVARIVAPDSIVLTALGDTARLAPVAYDRAGATVADASFTFASLDPSVISATAGLLSAGGAGVGRVVSWSEGRADTTRVFVVPTPARVVSSPESIALASLGDTATFTAVVQDHNGNPIAGETVTWTSLNSSVASIVGPGTAVARANGAAGIVATRGGYADTVWVNVTQRVARLAVTPDSSFVANPGDTTRLTAAAFDARDNAIPAPVSLTWIALDPAGVTVDSLGLATGVAPVASARVVARSGLVADTVRVTVGVTNPVPVVTSVTPANAQVIAAPPLVTVIGTGFVPVSVIRINGTDRPTEFVSATQLRTQATAADVAAPGAFTVVVFSPGPGGGTSSMRWVPIVSPTPVITASSPTSIPVNSGDTVMTVLGTGFIPQSRATVDGWNAVTTFVSTTELRVTAPAYRLFYPHMAPIMVINPDPARIPDKISNNFPFEVRATPPVVTSISPSSVVAGSAALTVRVTGSGFFLNSTVRLNGVDRPTTLIDPTRLDVVLDAADLSTAGTFPITVFTNGPGGGESNTVALVVSAAPPP